MFSDGGLFILHHKIIRRGILNIMNEFTGIHILGELYGVSYEKINSLDFMETLLVKGIEESNATICGTSIKKFKPQGLTILILLSESHVAVHTYPEKGSIFFDIFTCGLNCSPDKFVERIIRELNPVEHNISLIERGNYNGSK